MSTAQQEKSLSVTCPKCGAPPNVRCDKPVRQESGVPPDRQPVHRERYFLGAKQK